jgi:uncharacterized protein YjaZ
MTKQELLEKFKDYPAFQIKGIKNQKVKSIFSELEEEKIFPRYMMVTEKKGYKFEKRLVLGKFGAMYVAVNKYQEENFNKGEKYNVCSWNFAKEIEEPRILEITIDDIAKKFNVLPEQVKIKK